MTIGECLSWNDEKETSSPIVNRAPLNNTRSHLSQSFVQKPPLNPLTQSTKIVQFYEKANNESPVKCPSYQPSQKSLSSKRSNIVNGMIFKVAENYIVTYIAPEVTSLETPSLALKPNQKVEIYNIERNLTQLKHEMDHK